MICLFSFLLSSEISNNFNPKKINNHICFELNEGIEILEILKLYPIQKEIILNLNMQLSNNIKLKKIDKKEKLRRGLLVGAISGVVGFLTGASITIRLLK